MPRLDHRLDPDTFVEQSHVLLRVLLDEINLVRQAQGLPLRTPQQLQQTVHAALVTVRRQAKAKEG